MCPQACGAPTSDFASLAASRAGVRKGDGRGKRGLLIGAEVNGHYSGLKRGRVTAARALLRRC
jgi:hypothetical protein